MPSLFSRENNQEQEPELPSNDDIFLIFSNKSAITGRNMGRYLGVPHGKTCSERYDYLIRWGSSRGVDYIPNERPINSKRATERNTNKLRSLQEMEDAGVPVPPFSTTADDLDYPMLGRSRNHTQGNDINLILQDRDRILTDGNDFFVEYIPTELEYRAHVVGGEVLLWREKRLRREADNHPYIRNYETGWIFANPRSETPSDATAIEAVEALGLDFSAVDMIRGEDGEDYVLEVNTAPSLGERNLERWGSRMAELVGIEEYPGMDHPDIEFEDAEEWADD